jgi:hypothetical protein
MNTRQSSAVDRALNLIRQGATPYSAAKAMGLAMTTIYRALERPENAAVRSIWDNRRHKP